MKNTNRYIYIRQGRIQSETLGGGGLIVFFHVKSFLTLLFAIGNIAAWEGHDPPPHSLNLLVSISGMSMRCVRSLMSLQTRAQHTPRARFVAHTNLSISLPASNKIDKLYIYCNGKLIINGLAVKILHNQVT